MSLSGCCSRPWPRPGRLPASCSAPRRRRRSTCRASSRCWPSSSAIAFLAGIAYALVAIPAQTGLQEDLPEEVRGRVFGVLNMLVSVASFLPIIIIAPISDHLGTTVVIVFVGVAVTLVGVVSVVSRRPTPAVAADASG